MKLDNKELGGLAGAGIALGAAAVGAWLTTRDKKHHPDSAPGWTQRRSFGEYEVVGRTVTIRKPRAELFSFWRDFQNLPQFMENVEKIVAEGSAGEAVWTILAPAGQTVDIKTEIARQEQDRLIAWRSVDGSDIETEGRVTFEDAPGDRGTRVSLIIAYKAPGGAVGKAIAKLFMREPEVQARHDLKRFKMLMETGEIATSARRKDQTRAAQYQQENAR